MTAMRAKCLSFIIENADQEIIERQKIATILWGSRSNFVNEASLTQILYLIRRDLKEFGVSDLFITIPRQGLQVNKDIAIKPIDTEIKKNRGMMLQKTAVALTTVFAVSVGIMMFINIH